AGMSRFRNTVMVAFFLPILSTLLLGCSKFPVGWPEKPGPRVLASFTPIYCFAVNVAGDDAAVQCVMSSEGPHGFEVSAKDRVKVDRAGLFLINGLMLDDDIAVKMMNGTENKNIKIVSLSERISIFGP